MSKRSWRDLLPSFGATKVSEARIAMTITNVGLPVSTPNTLPKISREGYEKNVMVFRATQYIATAVAGVQWLLYKKGATKRARKVEIEGHELLDLLDRPNPMTGGNSLMEAMAAYFVLNGNVFLELNNGDPNNLKRPPTELWVNRPDLFKIIPNRFGMVGKFEFQGTIKKQWDVDFVTMRSNIIHMKSFHPTDPWYGLGRLSSALLSMDQSNAANRYNLAFLQNQARPSGVLVVKSSTTNPGAKLDDKTFERVKAELENHIGPSNAGKPMLMEGNLEWQNIGLTHQDMQFVQNRATTAADICLALGVPPILMNIGQMTYANYAEARLSFYLETVIPMLDFFKGELNNSLVKRYGEGIELDYDKDGIEALTPMREKKFTTVNNANHLTIDEKREATGYEPLPKGGDKLLVGTTLIDPAAEAELEEEELSDEDEEGNSDEASEQEDGEGEGSSDGDPEEPGSAEEDEEQEPSGKSFNPLNRNERRSAWKRQNWRRERLEKGMARDLDANLVDLAQALKESLASVVDPRTAEFALQKTVAEEMPIIQRTLRKYIRRTIEDFGRMIFTDAKNEFKELETKSSTWNKVPGMELKAPKKWEDWAKSYIERRTATAIQEIEGATNAKVRQVVKRLTQATILEGTSNQELAAELGEEFEGLSKGRARTIARTEVSMASSNTNLEGVRSLEIPGMEKGWATSGDDRTRDGKNGGADHEAMDDVWVPLDEKFTVPPDASLEGPGDPSGPADQVINCRCVLIFRATR